MFGRRLSLLLFCCELKIKVPQDVTKEQTVRHPSVRPKQKGLRTTTDRNGTT
jgi:hypothetical protein